MLNEATKNHDQVVAFFLYKKFDNQEVRSVVSVSLKNFKKDLLNYIINLEIIEPIYKAFFEKLFIKKNFSIYWNKTYEPKYFV